MSIPLRHQSTILKCIYCELDNIELEDPLNNIVCLCNSCHILFKFNNLIDNNNNITLLGLAHICTIMSRLSEDSTITGTMLDNTTLVIDNNSKP